MYEVCTACTDIGSSTPWTAAVIYAALHDVPKFTAALCTAVFAQNGYCIDGSRVIDPGGEQLVRQQQCSHCVGSWIVSAAVQQCWDR